MNWKRGGYYLAYYEAVKQGPAVSQTFKGLLLLAYYLLQHGPTSKCFTTLPNGITSWEAKYLHLWVEETFYTETMALP